MQKEILGHVRNSWEFMCVCVYMHEREKRTRQAKQINQDRDWAAVHFLLKYIFRWQGRQSHTLSTHTQHKHKHLYLLVHSANIYNSKSEARKLALIQVSHIGGRDSTT